MKLILNLLTANSDISSHNAGLHRLMNWYDEHHLHINTEEMIIDSRSVGEQTPINTWDIGTGYSDSALTWHMHMEIVYKTIHQCLCFLWRL